MLAMIQAYSAVGIGLIIGLGALGACVGVGIMCSRFLEGAARQLEAGGRNPLIDLVVADPDFRLERSEVEAWLDPKLFTGRSEAQVEELLSEVVEPALAGIEETEVEEPQI
jgi:hypothetical protein